MGVWEHNRNAWFVRMGMLWYTTGTWVYWSLSKVLFHRMTCFLLTMSMVT